MNLATVLELMSKADMYATQHSGCRKVVVGSVLSFEDGGYLFGCNTSDENSICLTDRGCLREELYGNNSKDHRLPSDCRATHSEIAALGFASRLGKSTFGATIIVTRYPCEVCARAIVSAGISTVYYGRAQKISELTRKIFESQSITVVHLPQFEAYDNYL